MNIKSGIVLSAIGLCFGLVQTASAYTISFTNSSEYSDSDVYVWFQCAYDGAYSGGYNLTNNGSAVTLGKSYSLADLTVGGVASVNTDHFISGRIYFSLGSALPTSALDANGIPKSQPGVMSNDSGYNVRFDCIEFTQSGSAADVADLSSMTHFGIPLTLQLRNSGTDLTGANTQAGWKGNTDAQIISTLSALVDPSASNVHKNDAGQFVRVNGATNYPALYHNSSATDAKSMYAYLDAIKAGGHNVTIEGNANGTPYKYVAVLSDAGYTLTKAADGNAASNPTTIFLPASYKLGPNSDDPTRTLAEAIYESNPWYSVDGGTLAPNQDVLTGCISRDLFAALNLGYVNSDHVIAASETTDAALVGKHIYELTTKEMQTLKIAFSQVNSYYNIYADAISKISDAYGYAYSDWNENLTKVAVLINANHGGFVADEMNVGIFGTNFMTAPEPSTIVLLTAGVAGMLRLRRHKRG